MKKELNLQCPYNVIIDTSAFIYSFITAAQIQYRITFTDSTSFYNDTSAEGLVTKVYSLTIEKTTPAKEPADINVQTTIDCIITHFFEDTDNSLICMCDNSDKREVARYRKFTMWYNGSAFKDKVIKIDESIINEDVTYFTSIMYHKDNVFQKGLKAGYYEVIHILRDK